MSVTTAEGAAAPEAADAGFIIRIALIATIGGFLFGFDSGVINGTVDGLRLAFGSEAAGTGLSVSSMLLGAAAGALAAGTLADRFGRRAMLKVSAVLFLVSAIGSGIASGVPDFVVYRLIGGFAVGAASVMAPAYIAEIAPARWRGALATAQQVAIVVGFFVVFLSNYALVRASGSAVNELAFGLETWRFMFWTEIVPALIFLLALFTIPESPRYLVAKGRTAEAGSVLGRLFGRGAEGKVAEIEASLERDHKPSFRDVKGPALGLRPIVWVGIGLAVFQQLVGINVIFYYGSVLWQSAGFTEENALLQNVLTGGTGIIAVLICLSRVDKSGRKPFLFWGSVMMVAFLGVMAWAFGTGATEAGGVALDPGIGRIALFSGIAYAFVFNMSWGPVMWIMLGEMFPNQMRGSALAIAGLMQWLANFLVTSTFPWMLENLGLGTSYVIYAAFAALSAVFVALAVKETAGRELEEMEG
jgi:SP family sugar:H+ symporter-like MFS transporter